MLFNRHGLQQKNWRMVKKGKHILFGCSLFFVVGGMSISGSQVAHASETNASRVVEEKVVANNTSSEISGGKASTLEKEQVSEGIDDKKTEKPRQTQDVEKKDQKENLTSESGEKALLKKEVNKKELKDLVDKIKKTDISKKTEKSVKELNLILSRVEKALANKEITQEEIDKEVKLLKEAFENLENKPREDKKSEIKEKDDKSSSEKDIKEKQQENNTEDITRRHNEKITKATNIVKEINSLASEINYEFSDSEKELVNTIEKLPTTDNNSEESIQKLLNEAIYLRNRVANRVTRANSGRRDPRNGKVIDKNGESGFRGVVYTHKENRRNGNLIENGSTAVYYNSDEIWSLIEIKGERVGNEKKFTTYVRGKIVEDVTPYYIVTVGFTSNSPIKGLKMQVAYWDKKAGVQRGREIEYGKTEINNPITNAAIRGVVGDGAIVQPGRYEVHIASNTRVAPNQLKPYTFTFIIKPQSERNTVKDLSLTYVDDVRHLTENEKTALIEKFKKEHPDVMTPSGHKSDFDHAEVSADGTTMTIHFKDGFNPKTIQTNATNDVEAKHQSITAYFGDSKELYTNPRQLVRSKTGNEVPSTAQVTYKTPFNLQQTGTRNVVVTTTYENGVTKDVTTPYTVLDFIGKQDKKINQNQSGQLGDARNYITVSDNSALPSELTVRWKGGSSTVDTSAAGVQHKEIEILRGNHLMKTVTIPVEIVDNINPTITAPDNITLTRLEGLPSEINIQVKDNDKGVGLKDGNAVTVENLPAPLTYNAAKSKIEINGVIPNNFQLGKSSIQVTVKAVDKKGNTATKNITFNIQSQIQKYTAVANSQIQEVSYGETPDAGTSIQKNGLPTGTRYSWATQPSTLTGPGDKTGVVTVTYPDGSTDTVAVTIKVRKLSDEYTPSAREIQVDQHATVSNEQLKAAVTATTKNGSIIRNDRISKVEAKININTSRYGNQMIPVKITYIDGSEHDIYIPLTIRDVTPPVIQTPVERENWKMTALDKTIPLMKVIAEDNAGGSGIGTITISNLPSFLVYDNTSRTIVFKQGVKEVDRAPKDSEKIQYGVTVKVIDNAGNPTSRTINITIYSMKGWFNPKQIPQVVNNGQVPNVESSINKTGLPEGTRISWKTPPVVNTPGMTTGQAEVEYPDGSKDVVTVNITVRKISEEYTATGTRIEVNQDEIVTPDMLKRAVNTINAQAENGISKVSRVESKAPINTHVYGSKTIQAKVIYVDGSEQDITIGLKVKDITRPTIENPDEGKNWELTALDTVLPNMMVRSEDNTDGSGIRTTTVTGLPDYLEYDSITKTIKFKTGKHKVERLSKNTLSKEFILTIQAEDNAGNISTKNAKITVYSMSAKNDPVGKPQTVDNGTVPEAEASVDKKNAPSGTTVRWKETPEVTTPGAHKGVAIVHYPDGSEEEVDVPITVKPQKDTYDPVGKPQTVDNGTVPEAEASVDKKNAPSGTTVRWKETPEVTTPGAHKGVAIVHYPDGSEEEVDVPITVKPQKDTYDPVGKPQTVDNGTVPEAEASVDKKNAPSGTTVRWKETPEVTTPGAHKGVAIVHYPDGSEEEVDVPITVKPQKDTYDPVGKPQTVDNGTVPEAEASVDKKNAPSGTTVRWKETPEVTTPGAHKGVAIVHYPDGSEEEVDVPITVKPQKDTYDPVGKPQTVDNGTVPEAEASVDKKNAPSGTTVRWKETPEVTTPGAHKGVAIVHYPDGSEEEVDVPITVKPQKDTYDPVGKPQTVDNGTVPEAEASVDKKNAPSGTTVRWKETPEVTTPGAYKGVAIVHYPDGSEEEVDVPITVKPQKDTYDPVGKPQTVDNGTVPEAEASVDKKNAPSGTTVRWKETPEVTTPGAHKGVAIVHYPDGSEEEVDVPITVKPQKDTYDPVGKPQTVDNGTVPEAEASVDKKNAPSGTTVRWKETPEVTTPGAHKGVAIVHYPDGSEEEVDVPITVKPQKDTYDPVGKPQTVDNGTVPEAEASVDKKNAPSGTTVRWKETPEVTTPGAHKGVAIVHYPDGSEEEVDVPITVKPQKDTYDPVGKPQTVDNGTVPEAEASVDKKNAPSGTTVRWKETPEVTTPGAHKGVAIVHYPDGSEEEVDVPITVKPQKDTYDPVGKPQTVDNGTVPEAEASVDKKNAPSGTTVRWKETPEVTTPGAHKGVAIVHYPDGSEEEVDVPITVKPQKDTYDPVGKPQTVDNGTVPEAEASVDKKNAPSGTTVRWKETPEVTTPGAHKGVAIVHYPDGSEEEVDVPITVKPQKDTYDPVGKPQTVDNGTVPEAEASVDKKNAPSGTTVRWKETPEVTTPGAHKGVAIVHYPDGSEEEVDVPITVKPQKDTYDPVGKPQTVDNGTVPEAEASVDKKNAPSGTTVRWKETPEVTTPGAHKGVAIVHYPDGSEEEVDVPITVKPQKDTYDPVGKPQTVDNGTVPEAEASVDKKNAPSGTTVRWKETPEVTTPGAHKGVAIVHYPDGSEEEVDVPITVKEQKMNGVPEIQQDLPEYNGGVNGDPEVQSTLPEFSGGVNGEPEEQPVLPEFGGGVNGEPEVQPALPEFSGGVNGEPEEQPVLPEFGGGVNGEPEVQPALPEFSGGVNGEPEVQPELPKYIGREDRNTNDHSNFQDKTPNRSTKRLANTGKTTNNSELAGLGLAIVGLFAAIKRRKNEED